jgi:N-acetylmuramic acid 6-phosphate etherase
VNDDLPTTERANPQTAQLDLLPTADLVALLVEDQRDAVEAVRRQSDLLAQAADEIARRIRLGGRLHYVGAGSSGRLGALDAAEMLPTFGLAPEIVRAHLAGGTPAFFQAVEGAEDDRDAGDAAVRRDVRSGDAVVGISASGGAPYVVAAIERARAIGACTIALTELAIVLETGPEAVTGSTRLKAGTAQKIALNAISTATMVRLGRVHGNSMVEVVASNQKLRDRAMRLVCEIANVDQERARDLLERARGRVKVAIVMARQSVDATAAETLLERRHGSLRALL